MSTYSLVKPAQDKCVQRSHLSQPTTSSPVFSEHLLQSSLDGDAVDDDVLGDEIGEYEGCSGVARQVGECDTAGIDSTSEVVDADEPFVICVVGTGTDEASRSVRSVVVVAEFGFITGLIEVSDVGGCSSAINNLPGELP